VKKNLLNLTTDHTQTGIELIRTHLVITISTVVSGRLGAMSRIEVFLHQA